MRDKAAKPKDLLYFCIEFFKEIDAIKLMQMSTEDRMLFASHAYNALKNKLKSLDPKVKSVDLGSFEVSDLNISNITIHWSKEYQIKNNCYESTSIDISETLFIE
jgi:hypothetical protein